MDKEQKEKLQQTLQELHIDSLTRCYVREYAFIGKFFNYETMPKNF